MLSRNILSQCPVRFSSFKVILLQKKIFENVKLNMNAITSIVIVYSAVM